MIPGQYDLGPFHKARRISLVVLVLAPLVYLRLPPLVDAGMKTPDGPENLMLYILLIIGIIEPVLYPIIERFQLGVVGVKCVYIWYCCFFHYRRFSEDVALLSNRYRMDTDLLAP
jgi:hypothetical protein